MKSTRAERERQTDRQAEATDRQTGRQAAGPRWTDNIIVSTTTTTTQSAKEKRGKL